MKKILVVAIMFVMYACGSGTNSEDCTTDECLKQEAYDKVIAVHDEVMPKLSQISELKAKLEREMDSSTDSLEVKAYLEIMEELDEADDSMWTWMRAFNSDIETWPTDSALNYLHSEQAKIDAVALMINKSIAKAEAGLQ